LETTEGFSYTVKAAPKGTEEKYLVTVAVTGEFPKERTAGTDEKPEDKERLDKEFKEKTGKLADKLKAEKALEGRIFVVAKYTLDSVLKKRGEFMKEEKKEDAKEDGAPPSLPPINPVDATLPPLPPGAE
jgi:hypothetical protein